MNSEVFLNRIVFLMRVFGFFGFGHFGRRFCGLFYLNLKVFFKQNCFFNGSGCFFGFRHFGKRFWAIFSYEFVRFFEADLFFQWKCLLFWLQAFWKTVPLPFFIWIYKLFSNRIVFSRRVFGFLASGILQDGSVAFFHMNL